MSDYGTITCLRCGGPVTVRCNCDLCEGLFQPSMMCACHGMVIDKCGVLYVAGRVYFQGLGCSPEHITRISCWSAHKLTQKKVFWNFGEKVHA